MVVVGEIEHYTEIVAAFVVVSSDHVTVRRWGTGELVVEAAVQPVVTSLAHCSAVDIDCSGLQERVWHFPPEPANQEQEMEILIVETAESCTLVLSLRGRV